MKIVNSCVSVLPAVIVMMLAGTPAAMGQETKEPAPVASTSISPEAKALMDAARIAYKTLKTYQDKVKLTFDMEAKDAEGANQNQKDVEEMSFLYSGARKFAVKHKDFAVVSDGETQTVHLAFLNQYLQRPARDGLLDEARLGPLGILSELHIPSVLLLTSAESKPAFPLLSEVTEVKAETRNNVAGKRIIGTGALPNMPFDAGLPMTMWFADDTGLIGEVTFDLKSAYTEMTSGERTIEKAMGTVAFDEIKVNAEIPAESYTFKPSEDDRKVESFEMDGGPDLQQELVGTPAVDFVGVDLDGKAMKLSDFKGKVVLLDFWATWCGPCMQMIPKIQELSAQFAGKEVVVIGMNQDDPESLDQVKEAVQKRTLTFRQFMDTDGAVSEQFQVSAIPCTVLIDGKGVIQWIHVGGSPSLKQEIAEKIERLLKGESLVEVKPAADKK